VSYLWTGITPLTRAIKHALAVQIIRSQQPSYQSDEDRQAIHVAWMDQYWREMTVDYVRPTTAQIREKCTHWTREDLETVGASP